MKRNKAKICYGPPGHETEFYWSVDVTDAKDPVIINGSAAAAMRSHPGVTVDCALSMTAQENAEKFGHQVYMVSATRTTMLVVDKIKADGSPWHAIRYIHSYASIVDANDNGNLKRLIKQYPELMEREFILRVPRERRNANGMRKRTHSTGDVRHGAVHGQQARYVPRGALARAVKAGRMGEHVANQMTRVWQRHDKEQKKEEQPGA